MVKIKSGLDGLELINGVTKELWTEIRDIVEDETNKKTNYRKLSAGKLK